MIPNYENIVVQTRNDYPRAWQHCHIAGDPEAWDFIILVSKRIYALDTRFGLNGKRGNPEDLSWDALNWIGTATDPPNVIDVVLGAGGTNPQPTWGITNTTGAYVNPTTKNTYYDYGSGGGTNPKPEPPKPKLPSYEELGGDASGVKVGNYLFHDYARAGSTGDPGMGVWFNRVMYDAISGIEKSYDDSIAKHRPGWCQGLGIPVDDYKP